jgi:uncharacterized membrane protein
MSQKHTAVELQAPSGTQVRAISHENDFPLPAVDELEKLHGFRPDLVDKVIEMTVQEAEHRRSRSSKIDGYVHRQAMVSTVGSTAVALLAFGGAIYLGYTGHEWPSIAIVGSTLGVVVYAIKKSKEP